MAQQYNDSAYLSDAKYICETFLSDHKVAQNTKASDVTMSACAFLQWDSGKSYEDKDITKSHRVYEQVDIADMNSNATNITLYMTNKSDHFKDQCRTISGYSVEGGNKYTTYKGIYIYAWTIRESTGNVWLCISLSGVKHWIQIIEGYHILLLTDSDMDRTHDVLSPILPKHMYKHYYKVLSKLYPSINNKDDSLSYYPTLVWDNCSATCYFSDDKSVDFKDNGGVVFETKVTDFVVEGGRRLITESEGVVIGSENDWPILTYFKRSCNDKKYLFFGDPATSTTNSSDRNGIIGNFATDGYGAAIEYFASGLRDGKTPFYLRTTDKKLNDIKYQDDIVVDRSWLTKNAIMSKSGTYGSIGWTYMYIYNKIDGTSNDTIWGKYTRENTYKQGARIKKYRTGYTETYGTVLEVYVEMSGNGNGDTGNYSGWVPVINGMYILLNKDGSGNGTTGTDVGGDPSTINPGNEPTEEQHQVEERQGSTEWENSADYQTALDAGNAQTDMNFWTQLYNGYGNTYSLKSHRSIIGLPLQFMPNVDMRVGSSTYGKQYMEDIIYDAAVVCIKPGGPVLNPKWSSGDTDDGSSSAPAYSDDGVTKLLASFGRWKAYWNMFKDLNSADGWKQLLYSVFTSGSARFYSFMQDYTHYTHYVNTLCHMFIAWLNIGEKEYYISNGIKKKYINFNEYYQELETDAGLGLNYQYGYDTAVYAYYSPESDINQTFSNSTTESQLSATIREASDVSKEWGFLMNAAGLEKGAGLFDWSSISTSISSFTSRIPVVGRLFGNLSEGVTTILAGNNMSLPEIYADSDTTTQHTFKIKLISPYGDPESIFWYVLRPLAKLLAFSLPRQYGPNSYTSPFIVQAFSKGQFNCQLGIVTELSVTRGGNGGESHTVHHLPTELEVSLTIADMYEKVFLSNEYFGNSNAGNVIGAGLDWLFSGGDTAYGTVSKLIQTGTTMQATHLMFNNVGLIDFTASLAGGNLNQPSFMSSWTFISQLMKNRAAETVVYENGEWRFPFWEKTLRDNFNQATTNIYSAISTGG